MIAGGVTKRGRKERRKFRKNGNGARTHGGRKKHLTLRTYSDHFLKEKGGIRKGGKGKVEPKERVTKKGEKTPAKNTGKGGGLNCNGSFSWGVLHDYTTTPVPWQIPILYLTLPL